MNNRTNRWAVQVTPKLSEAVQRIAFSYGYKWHAGPSGVRYTQYPFLIVHPDTKAFGFCEKDPVENQELVSRVVTTFEDVIDLFNNPPESPLVVEGTVILRNGDVKPHALELAAEHFDKVVKARDELLARNRKELPVVTFVYTSQSSTKKDRRVAVTKFARMFIEGYDIDDKNRYKRFLMDRINGFVAFDGFVDNP